jgi:hypothetical protein
VRRTSVHVYARMFCVHGSVDADTAFVGYTTASYQTAGCFIQFNIRCHYYLRCLGLLHGVAEAIFSTYSEFVARPLQLHRVRSLFRRADDRGLADLPRQTRARCLQGGRLRDRKRFAARSRFASGGPVAKIVHNLIHHNPQSFTFITEIRLLTLWAIDTENNSFGQFDTYLVTAYDEVLLVDRATRLLYHMLPPSDPDYDGCLYEYSTLCDGAAGCTRVAGTKRAVGGCEGAASLPRFHSATSLGELAFPEGLPSAMWTESYSYAHVFPRLLSTRATLASTSHVSALFTSDALFDSQGYPGTFVDGVFDPDAPAGANLTAAVYFGSTMLAPSDWLHFTSTVVEPDLPETRVLGEQFVLDKQGFLVASSQGEVQRCVDNQPGLVCSPLHVLDSEVPAVRAAARALMQASGSAPEAWNFAYFTGLVTCTEVATEVVDYLTWASVNNKTLTNVDLPDYLFVSYLTRSDTGMSLQSSLAVNAVALTVLFLAASVFALLSFVSLRDVSLVAHDAASDAPVVQRTVSLRAMQVVTENLISWSPARVAEACFLVLCRFHCCRAMKMRRPAITPRPRAILRARHPTSCSL